MDVVAIVSQKGGVGKSTIAISLAIAAERAGKTAAIVDLDPQATATTWADRRKDQPPPVVSAQAARLPQVLKAAEEQGASFVVIDTPPRVEQAAIAAIKAAHLVLIPCRPAIFDLDTVETTLELIRMAGNPKVAAVLNAVPSQGAEREQSADVLRAQGVAVVPVALGHRKAFTHSAALGQGPQEFDPAGKAALEIEQLYEFVSKLLNTERSEHVKNRSTRGDALEG